MPFWKNGLTFGESEIIMAIWGNDKSALRGTLEKRGSQTFLTQWNVLTDMQKLLKEKNNSKNSSKKDSWPSEQVTLALSICQKQSLDPTLLLSFIFETWLKFLKDFCTESQDIWVMPHKKKKKITMRKNILLKFLKCIYKFAHLLQNADI